MAASTVDAGRMVRLDRPNVIGAGFPKAGTSFIASVLAKHPSICFPSANGESRKTGMINLFESPEADDLALADYVRANYSTYQADTHTVMMEWRTGYTYSEPMLHNSCFKPRFTQIIRSLTS